MKTQTINGKLAIFSDPVTKLELIDRLILVMCHDIGEKGHAKMVDFLMQYTDSRLVKYWNRKMNVAISVFAPGMFSFRYNDEFIFN